MKSYIFAIAVAEEVFKAVLKTNDDGGNCNRFTVMTVDRPDEVPADVFPFRPGDVLSVDEILKYAGNANADGNVTINSVNREDGAKSETLTIPVMKDWSIEVTNEGATLTVNNEVQKSLKVSGRASVGETIAYKAELEGKTTNAGTIQVKSDSTTAQLNLKITLS